MVRYSRKCEKSAYIQRPYAKFINSRGVAHMAGAN
jgi:hypothetical protein